MAITIPGMKSQVQAKAINLVWIWWDEINKIREGERGSDHILAFAGVEIVKIPKRTHTWGKPEQVILKINCDGSFYPISNT